jgi:cyclic pyranopterin phosphate synthase
MPTMDRLGRPLRNLRISVTDRCNLRCQYCMPEQNYVWLPRQDILDFEEVSALVDVFIGLGVDRVRLTGGEPLLRHELPVLDRQLAAKAGLRDLALTTNGLLLAEQARELRAAGLRRLTISLDTLRAERFVELARREGLASVLEGIEAANVVGFQDTKIDTVVIRGTNDDELVDIIEYGKRMGVEVRFIEYMDVGGATRWSMDKVVSCKQMLDALAEHYGPIVALREETSAPAARFRLPDGTVFGIISSTTAPFCRSCDRARLTADGMWYLCLYAASGIDLRGPLRAGASVAEIESIILGGWRARDDRGAEQRLESMQRLALVDRKRLQQDPHLEMHTRGG